MGVNTSIQWCDYTFNPWIGCTKVSPGCEHCYAEADFDNRRHIAKWGPAGTRVMTSVMYWKQPASWNREAIANGVRRRVFCASLADVFEQWQGVMHERVGGELFMLTYDGGVKRVRMRDVRERLFRLIDDTPQLDWLLLTKRPANIVPMWSGADPRKNAWLLTSVEDQQRAEERIPHLLACRRLAPVLGLSVEPLLGPVYLSPWLDRLDWVIVGGESGPQARPCDVAWIASIVEQCRRAGVPCFVKQLGRRPLKNGVQYKLNHLNGGDPSEWPPDLRVREFPRAKGGA